MIAVSILDCITNYSPSQPINMMKDYKRIVWLVAIMMVMAISCKDDEPAETFDSYYLDIQSLVSLNLDDDDEEQGTMPKNGHADVLSKTIRKMKEALAEATSEENSRQANDAAAMKACDEIYNDYATAYAGSKGNTVCTVKMIRRKKVDQVRQEIVTLRTYHFWTVDLDPNPLPTTKIEKPEILAQVDLGLSVNWANCNLAAKQEEDYGAYYAWGDPTGKLWSADGIGYNSKGYTWRSEDYGGVNPPTDISGTELDIVAMNWEDGWRLPTYEEAKELRDKCQWKLRSHGDIKWFEVIGPNGNSIVMPLTGLFSDDLGGDRFHKGPYGVNQTGYYWTSTICPTPLTTEQRGYAINDGVATAWLLYCYSGQDDTDSSIGFIDELRAMHRCIRAVHDK